MGMGFRRPHHHQHHKHTGAMTEELSSYVVVVRRRRTPPQYIYLYYYIFYDLLLGQYIDITYRLAFDWRNLWFLFGKPSVLCCITYGFQLRNRWFFIAEPMVFHWETTGFWLRNLWFFSWVIFANWGNSKDFFCNANKKCDCIKLRWGNFFRNQKYIWHCRNAYLHRFRITQHLFRIKWISLQQFQQQNPTIKSIRFTTSSFFL